MDAVDIISEIRELNLPDDRGRVSTGKGEYVVVGGAVKALHGLRQTDDIDIVVSSHLYHQLKAAGWTSITFPDGNAGLACDRVEIMLNWGGELEQLLPSAEETEGIPIVGLEKVLEWKLVANRAKDQADILKLKAYLGR
ncbi:MAG: hypothetical protein WD467_01300 [Candidatus Saccharimonadales bacterium]